MFIKRDDSPKTFGDYRLCRAGQAAETALPEFASCLLQKLADPRLLKR